MSVDHLVYRGEHHTTCNLAALHDDLLTKKGESQELLSTNTLEMLLDKLYTLIHLLQIF